LLIIFTLRLQINDFQLKLDLLKKENTILNEKCNELNDQNVEYKMELENLKLEQQKLLNEFHTKTEVILLENIFLKISLIINVFDL
jgi:predicted nuclease with TOPRIM domain